MASPTWITLYLDEPAANYQTAIGFWSAVTGWQASEPDGDDGEYVELLAPGADHYLGVQRLGSGEARIHLDLEVENRQAAVGGAAALGAEVLDDAQDTWTVLRSPGGLVFCFVDAYSKMRPEPVDIDGHKTLADQVCVDIPHELWDTEVSFWQKVTGWKASPARLPEFARLATSTPVRVLLQRQETEGGVVTAHLDIATEDREAEVARQIALGATKVCDNDFWTVMKAPTGTTYCITGRSPVTGLLVGPGAGAS